MDDQQKLLRAAAAGDCEKIAQLRDAGVALDAVPAPQKVSAVFLAVLHRKVSAGAR